MPLQNRVDPVGALQSVSARGGLLGNRGVLHDQDRNIVRPWAGKGWVTCVLDYPGEQQTVFKPGAYSQLFFLDEATAFAAGHRPCGSCRHQRYREFREQWLNANPDAVDNEKVTATDIDKVLHAERAVRGGGKVTFETSLDTLPFGVFIEWKGAAHLVTDRALLPWSFHGYGQAAPLPELGMTVTVLTPASIVRLFRQGFRPQVDESAGLDG
jgi:hypothetical protein